MIILKSLVLLAILAWAIVRSIKKDASGVFLFNPKAAIPPVLFLVATMFLFPAIGQVGAGERGVVLQFGRVTGRILGEGIYTVVPLAESVEIMDVQVHAHGVPAAGASSDLQNVTTEITLNYALLPDGVASVYQDLRRDYVERVIAPAVQEAVKSCTANFTAEELISKRPAVKQQIEEKLALRLASHQIRVDAVSVTNFQFSPEFTDQIEKKVTAAQRALTAQNDLATVQFVAQQRVETAKAEAEAIRIQAQSISAQGGESYVQLKWVEKWDGRLPTTTLGSGTGMLLNVGAGR